MEAMGYLANYYSAKIHGAMDLALFDKSGKVADRGSAIKNLQAALESWKRYARAYTVQYLWGGHELTAAGNRITATLPARDGAVIALR